MNGTGLLPMVIEMVQADFMVAPWKEVMVLKLNHMGHGWRSGTSARLVMTGPKFHRGLLQLRMLKMLNPSKYFMIDHPTP